MTENKNFNLFGNDIFGDPITVKTNSIIKNKFLLPPFSVLNAREGAWQERKRAWTSVGIKSEVGRNQGLTHNTEDWFEKNGKTGGGKTTSLFDPVLCELMYTWFCKKGGQIIDPFAGGSVRGIVASLLGYRYWGCDLREEQIDANQQQANEILGKTVRVKISKAMIMQKFHPCEINYINSVCRGRCCEGSNGLKVAIHPTEARKFREKGAVISDGFIVADERGLCPFKGDDGTCRTHEDKPLGCRFSPFTLNSNDTLIVRNRYRLLRCYNCEESLPAYKSHAWSLYQIFGEKEALRITKLLDESDSDIFADMPLINYSVMKDNDSAKGAKVESSKTPIWVCGDSIDTMQDAPDADFIFSCPPYGDLEKYSDEINDLSNMEYNTFIAAYKRIILRCFKKLKNNRFACFVVGDFRDKKTGNYRGFVADTINAFKECGFELYNDSVLVTSVGSLPIRITKQFNASRKMGKTHQNVLVFVKGSARVAISEMEQK